eukprot:3515842-Rhodomonas_salina.4
MPPLTPIAYVPTNACASALAYCTIVLAYAHTGTKLAYRATVVAYALAMRCPVPHRGSAISCARATRCPPYAMPGTELAYRATLSAHRSCCAMPGTDLSAYVLATWCLELISRIALRDVQLEPPLDCPRRYAITLRSRYAMSGTDIPYGATQPPYVPLCAYVLRCPVLTISYSTITLRGLLRDARYPPSVW